MQADNQYFDAKGIRLGKTKTQNTKKKYKFKIQTPKRKRHWTKTKGQNINTCHEFTPPPGVKSENGMKSKTSSWYEIFFNWQMWEIHRQMWEIHQQMWEIHVVTS